MEVESEMGKKLKYFEPGGGFCGKKEQILSGEIGGAADELNAMIQQDGDPVDSLIS